MILFGFLSSFYLSRPALQRACKCLKTLLFPSLNYPNRASPGGCLKSIIRSVPKCEEQWKRNYMSET